MSSLKFLLNAKKLSENLGVLPNMKTLKSEVLWQSSSGTLDKITVIG